MPADHRSKKGLRRGFVIGELLVALLLLAVAVSSLAALMYSVTRRPSTADKTVCVGRKGASAAGCASLSTGEGGASKLLRSGCATRVGFAVGCKDTVVSREVPGESSDETILRARTDSAAMALLAKKARLSPERPDRGFIR
jgi:hypothetical protein